MNTNNFIESFNKGDYHNCLPFIHQFNHQDTYISAYIKNVIYFYKYLLYNYLHLRPACDPFICVRTSSSLSSGGPDEWGVCAVGVVAVGVSPGIY